MTIQDISKKEFSKSILGYDCKEVDSFLDTVMDRMTEYEYEKKEILSALEYLLKELENSEVRNQKVNKNKNKPGIQSLDNLEEDSTTESKNASVSDMLKQIEESIEKEIHFSDNQE